MEVRPSHSTIKHWCAADDNRQHFDSNESRGRWWRCGASRPVRWCWRMKTHSPPQSSILLCIYSIYIVSDIRILSLSQLNMTRNRPFGPSSEPWHAEVVITAAMMEKVVTFYGFRISNLREFELQLKTLKNAADSILREELRTVWCWNNTGAALKRVLRIAKRSKDRNISVRKNV